MKYPVDNDPVFPSRHPIATADVGPGQLHEWPALASKGGSLEFDARWSPKTKEQPWNQYIIDVLLDGVVVATNISLVCREGKTIKVYSYDEPGWKIFPIKTLDAEGKWRTLLKPDVVYSINKYMVIPTKQKARKPSPGRRSPSAA